MLPHNKVINFFRIEKLDGRAVWLGEPRDVTRLIRIGGYVFLIGILIGITLGVYSFFNPSFFLEFLNLSEYEAPSFFLGLYLPGLVATVGIGYALATRPKLISLKMSGAAFMCVLIVICLTLASLSIFNLLAVVGGIIALAAVISALTKPSFKILWRREASFLVELGSMLIVSASMLFLLMLFLSTFFRTYSPGVYAISSGYPYMLMVIGVMSLLTFAITPVIGMEGSKTGLIGILASATGLASFFAAIQNEYVYSNPAVYQGLSLLGIGIAIELAGAFVYFKLFLTGELVNESFTSSFVYKGVHCPHCGAIWRNSNQQVCLSCNLSLYSEQPTSFCPHCGRLVNKGTRNCSHCGEDVTSLPVHILMTPQKGKRKLFEKILMNFGISAKEFFTVIILTAIFNFLVFLIYVRVQSSAIGFADGSTTIRNYGLPLEWLQIIGVWESSPSHQPGVNQWSLNFAGVAINYATLILDLSLYFLLAYALVYGIARFGSMKTRFK
jgi:hypothetical protein